MRIGNILTSIAKPLLGVIDQFVDDDDLRAKLRAEMMNQLLDNQGQVAQAAAEVVTAEAQGESWMQRNWRPILMFFCMFLIGMFFFGFVPTNMPVSAVDALFNLLTIGVGGYVVGRSGEKIASRIADGMQAGRDPY